jgi:flagellar biosynthesis protein FlhG
MNGGLSPKGLSLNFNFGKELVFSQAKSSSSKKRPRIWTVASGKGGVGKTFISTSLGVTLAKLGLSVVVIDLDISGANVHTALGFSPQPIGLRQFLTDKGPLREFVTPTKLSSLSFIQGIWNSWTHTDLSEEQVQSILTASRTLPYDFVVFDLGAGTLKSHLRAFHFADERFLVTSPEPTSLEKNYRFLEAYVSEDLKQYCNAADYQDLLRELENRKSTPSNQVFSFRSFIESHENIQLDYFRLFEQAPIRLVVNPCRTAANLQLGDSIISVCKRFFNLKIELFLSLDFDIAVWQCIKNREPFLQTNPMSPLAGQFSVSVKQLIGPYLREKVS